MNSPRVNNYFLRFYEFLNLKSAIHFVVIVFVLGPDPFGSRVDDLYFSPGRNPVHSVFNRSRPGRVVKARRTPPRVVCVAALPAFISHHSVTERCNERRYSTCEMAPQTTTTMTNNISSNSKRNNVRNQEKCVSVFLMPYLQLCPFLTYWNCFHRLFLRKRDGRGHTRAKQAS